MEDVLQRAGSKGSKSILHYFIKNWEVENLKKKKKMKRTTKKCVSSLRVLKDGESGRCTVPEKFKIAAISFRIRMKNMWMKDDPGIDGILVTVGLCIIALLLCVVMKDSLTEFIKTMVNSMTTEAMKILQGTKG